MPCLTARWGRNAPLWRCDVVQSGKGGRRAESVSTAAGSVYWQRWGAGPDVLLLHGIPSSSRLWQSTAESLESVATVHMLDLLGYGRSDKPVAADLGIAAQAAVVREWMAVTGWSTGTVVGHDIGGGVAQLLAVNDPDCVSQLVLVDTIAYDSWPEPGIKRLGEPQWDEIMERIDLSVGLRKGLLRGVVDDSVVTDELVQAYAAPFAGPGGGAAYLRCARALRTPELLDVADAVEHLTLPTHIVWGTQDVFQPLSYGERLSAAIQGARLTTLEAGHFLPLERGPELAALIAEGIQGPRCG